MSLECAFPSFYHDWRRVSASFYFEGPAMDYPWVGF